MNEFIQFPAQQLSYKRKTKTWRKLVVDWAASKAFFNYSPVRRSVLHKKINYNLFNGKLYMKDLMLIVNPDNLQAGYIPDNIQHYPIMNSKLNVLRGEESKRVFDYRVVVTNPNGITEIEKTKKQQILAKLLELVADTSLSEEEFNNLLEGINEYFTYEYQDFREIRANALLNHYVKELNMPLMFNKGFMDAMIVAEEIYACDIVGGEPTIEKLNPNNIRVFRSGYSDKIEDADVIIYEDYWSPGRIIDTFHDSLTTEDMKYIENIPNEPGEGSSSEPDPRLEFVHSAVIGDDELMINPTTLFPESIDETLMPYDTNGNIRVIRIYWKSRKKIKKVKHYNPDTGEDEYEFYDENYIINKDLGEEEEPIWINEAWEGTKIGEKIYVNMRPRLVLYNRISNPSLCHFGIVGSVYNLNESKPYSLVDMMKPYNYLYDAVHDRLNKLLAKNWGKIMKLDLAMVPAKWTMDKWLHYAKTANIAVIDSFKEGTSGLATGKLAGALNNNSTGVIDTELGNSIQMNINLLEFIKEEMSEVAGISKQREGLISNRETVGGVERATLQSSHITEWLFFIHEDVKRRALECFLETAKIALRGGSKKFQYILSDGTMLVMDIDGDEFAENDYGLVVDNSNSIQELQQKMDLLAQAALQNQTLNFSTIMKLYNSSSLAEKQRMVEKNEQELMLRQQEAQQQQMLAEQQKAQMEAQQKEAEMQLKDAMNLRDNETKILVATISANSQANTLEGIDTEDNRAKLELSIKEFDEKMKLERDKFSFDKYKTKEELRLKEKQINKKPNTSK